MVARQVEICRDSSQHKGSEVVDARSTEFNHQWKVNVGRFYLPKTIGIIRKKGVFMKNQIPFGIIQTGFDSDVNVFIDPQVTDQSYIKACCGLHLYVFEFTS